MAKFFPTKVKLIDLEDCVVRIRQEGECVHKLDVLDADPEIPISKTVTIQGADNMKKLAHAILEFFTEGK